MRQEIRKSISYRALDSGRPDIMHKQPKIHGSKRLTDT